jgi:tetratricopeptide (TPR) repeat protein
VPGAPDLLLADIARNEHRTKDAIALYRRYHQLDFGDAESHFALAELTGDASEYQLAWSLLPPGERKIRIRILIWKKDYEAAIALLKEERDWETMVDLLFELKRFKEASKYPLTVRQQAIVAYHLGKYEEAVKLLRQLDLQDPGIRIALGDWLFGPGARRVAGLPPELKKHIAEPTGRNPRDVQMLQGPLDHQVRRGPPPMYLGQPPRPRPGAGPEPDWRRGPLNRSVQVEQADAWIHYLMTKALRLSAGAGGWHSDSARLRKDWRDEPRGGVERGRERPGQRAPIDSIRTAVLG